MRRLPRQIGRQGEVVLWGGIPSDIGRTWVSLFDCAGFFNDLFCVTDERSLAEFFQRNVLDAAFARDIDGEIVSVAYVVPETPFSLCFHAYSHPRARKPAFTIPCAKAAIRYFFESFPIVKLTTIGRWEDRLARLVAARLGFRMEGRLRSAAPYNGEFKDCYYGSILKTEI